MSYHKGYGITNYKIQRKLKKMDAYERELYEKHLKNDDEKKYNEFKEWQGRIMRIAPKYKIDY